MDQLIFFPHLPLRASIELQQQCGNSTIFVEIRPEILHLSLKFIH